LDPRTSSKHVPILNNEGSPGQTSEVDICQTLKENRDFSNSDQRYYIPNKNGNCMFFGLRVTLYNTSEINSEEQFPRSRKSITLEEFCSKKLPAKIKYPLSW
jgi:hypothetical protein